MNKEFVFDVDSEVAVAATQVQSPWEFSGYSATVLDEHANRKTTSVNQKIAQLRSKKGNLKPNVSRVDDDSDEHEEDLDNKSGVWKRALPYNNGDSNAADGSESDGDDSDVEDDTFAQETGHWEEEEGSDISDVETDDDDSQLADKEEDGDSDVDSQFEDGEEDDDEDVEEEEEAGDEEEDGDDRKFESWSRKGRKIVESDGDEEPATSTKAKKKGLGAVRVHVEDALATKKGQDAEKKPGKFFASSEGASFSAKSFTELNISRPLIRACEALGYKQPTPIQAACIPLALTGRDICGSAVTGSGKTAAFGLPILERLLFRPRRIPAIRVLILTPTRELAVQVHSMLQKLAQFTDVSCCLVVGGLSSKVQETALRARPDIVVATPGRMIDHLHNAQSVGLEELAILVLDEADRLLELGFTKEVHELVRMCPKRRQTMLFSATMTEEVDALVQLSLNGPVRLSADPSTKRPVTLSEEVVKIRPALEGDKEAVLLALCTRTFISKVIIFSGTKVEAHRLKILFGLSGLKAAELHGNLTQAMRLDALESFRKQEVDYLIATDVAARGLDIMGVETVVNFHCPRDITMYVHRVGRTARAGREGCAVTFVTERERSLLKSIAKRAGSKLQNRQVAPAAISKWRSKIEGMEDDVRAVQQEEREERALRKAEMEANKAQNMMDHEAEIYSRPKREWFQSTRDKRMIAAEAKAAKDGTRKRDKDQKVMSVEDAEEKKRKEKRKREREKNMTRKQRRRLEAEREDAEDMQDEDNSQQDDDEPRKKSKKGENKSSRQTVADLAYRRAKAAKSTEKLVKAGKIGPQKKNKGKVDGSKKSKVGAPKSRKDEMEEMFQDDRSDGKQRKPGREPSRTKKPTRKPGVSKRSFKSKSRYKRHK